MIQRGCVVFEIVKNERPYSLNVPLGAPLKEAYDATLEFMQALIELDKQQAAQTAAQQEPSSSDESSSTN